MDPLTILLYVGLFILSQLLQPKPKIQNAKPAGLGDFDFPTATEGRAIPLLWGTCQLKGPNVVWYGDFQQVPILQTISSLFSHTSTIVGFKYRLGMQLALCRGPGVQTKRVWIGDNEVFTGTLNDQDLLTIDCPSLFGGDTLGNGGIQGVLRFFAGGRPQAKSTYLSQFQQTSFGGTPRYNGTCYFAPDTGNIYLGNSTSIAPWSFECTRIPNGLGLGSTNIVNGADANPMNVVYEYITDTEWGLGQLPARINIANFTAAAATLFTEGNGFSMLLDQPMQGVDFLKLLQEQIDGIIYQNRFTGLWEVKLARADYTPSAVPEINTSNMVELESFARGTWRDTTNDVRIKFNQRSDDYKETFAPAQDTASIRVLQGTVVTGNLNYPGVKDPTLADSIAWRELRRLSYPLSKASVIVDRTFFDVQPWSVYAFTHAPLGINRLMMRVQSVDLGELVDGKIRLSLVQDVFLASIGSFGPPPDTNWVPPTDTLQPFDADKQISFESPRAFATRDPQSGDAILSKVWCGARRKGPEVGFQMVARYDPSSPSGPFAAIGSSYSLFLIGQLQSSLAVGSAVPLTTLIMLPGPDTKVALEAAFQDTTDPTVLGTGLVNLILVDTEFMLPTGAQVSGSNVQLNGVYRGVLDSVQESHAAGAKVYLLCVGGGLSDATIPEVDVVNVKLLPFSSTDEVLDTAATQIAFSMDKRTRRPYAPSRSSLSGTAWASTASLEAHGAGDETYALDLSVIRRDYRTSNEVPPLSTDAAAIFSDFPSANSTTTSVTVRNDPLGANTLLFTDTWTGTQHDILRIKILKAMLGVLPTSLRLELKATHTDGGSSLDSRYHAVHDFAPTSTLTGQFAFGALAASVTSNVYTATVIGTYNFTLSSAFTTGNVEYRISGGAWTTLILAGATTGTVALTSSLISATVAAGGTAYSNGDLLTLVGGTHSAVAQVTPTALILSPETNPVTVNTPGTYTVLPTNPIATTGGTGSGCTINGVWSVPSPFTIEVRHLSTDVGALKQLDMVAPSGGQNAYAILYT